MFRVIANAEIEFVFSTQSTVVLENLFVHILQKKMRICPLIERKAGPFQTLRFVGLMLMLDGKLILSTPSTFFLSKHFETLYKCNRHTVKMFEWSGIFV